MGKPGSKVERDIWNAAALVGEMFGSDIPGVTEAVAQARKHAGGSIPDPPEKKNDGKEVELVLCEKCGSHHVPPKCGETVPASPAPPAKTSSGPDLFCVYDRNCCFLRPYRSANEAARAAKECGGYIRVVPASDLPEDGEKDTAR